MSAGGLDRPVARRHRLHLTGNGVVPLTAALAFTTLAERLGVELSA